MLYVTKNCHSKDGIDEHYQRKKHSNVEQGWQGDDESEEEFADAFRRLDEAKNSTDAEDSDHPQQSRRDEHLGQ